MKLLGGGVSMGDTTRNKQTTTDHFLGGRNPRLIPFWQQCPDNRMVFFTHY